MRYTRPHGSTLNARLAYPSEVGFIPDLYRSPEKDSSTEHWLETNTFQLIDNHAAKILHLMDTQGLSALDHPQRCLWAVFILSLFHRTPNSLANTKLAAGRVGERLLRSIGAEYDTLRSPNDPQTFGEFIEAYGEQEREISALRLLPSLMTSPRIGTYIVNMRWAILTLPDSCHRLLISDDPIARTNGLAVEGGHLAMPLSPDRFLLLTNSSETMETMLSAPIRNLAAELNKWSVESARQFVGAVDRTQERFIQNRFGTDQKPSVAEGVGMEEGPTTGDRTFALRMKERQAILPAQRNRLLFW